MAARLSATCTRAAPARYLTAMQFRCSSYLVADVPSTVEFYQKAFGFALHHMHPSASYAELETGNTRLSFISEDLVRVTKMFGGLSVRPNRVNAEPAGTMIVLVADDLEREWDRAVAAGATVIAAPERKPWGETLGYLRDANGIIVEMCAPRDAGYGSVAFAAEAGQ